MSKLNNLRKRFINAYRVWIRDPLDDSPITNTDAAMGSYGLASRQIADQLTLAVQYAHSANVSGDIVEFGTQTGHTARVISLAMQSFCPRRKLHLFDSFLGLPSVDNPVDGSTPDVVSGVWGAGQLVGVTRRRLADLVSPIPHVIHAGWFKGTISDLAGVKLAMVHIDCDLYESTVDVLDGMRKHGLFQDGQIILFDDFNCNLASKKFGQRAAFDRIKDGWRDFQFELIGFYGWSGACFIAHAN